MRGLSTVRCEGLSRFPSVSEIAPWTNTELGGPGGLPPGLAERITDFSSRRKKPHTPTGTACRVAKCPPIRTRLTLTASSGTRQIVDR